MEKTKHKKMYYLTGYISAETLKRSAYSGQIFEIKKNANPGKESIKNFNVVKRFEMNSPNGIVLCLSKDIHLINENNYIVPIEYV